MPDLHGPPLPHTERLPGGRWIPLATPQGHLSHAVWHGYWVTLCALRWIWLSVEQEWVREADVLGKPLAFPPPADFGDDERLRAAEEKREKRANRGLTGTA